MLFFIRTPDHRLHGGCLNTNIGTLCWTSDANQESYLSVVKQKFPPTPSVAPWIRDTRYGISVVGTTKPDWNNDGSRYWANMYYRPTASEIMATRKIMFSPILWTRQTYGQEFMCRWNSSPYFFGRDNSTDAVAISDANNIWRTDIRANLECFITENIGTTGGEPYLTRVKTSNMNVKMIYTPNEVDWWPNARWYYVADEECSGGQAPSESSRSGVANLSGSAGLSRLLLRIRDHQLHTFEFVREVRPDIGVMYPSIVDVRATTQREFNIYTMLTWTNSGSGLTQQGNINDICDAHQIHPHMSQWEIPDHWSGSSAIRDEAISPYHYWKANQQVQAWRASNQLPDNTRPLLSTETGIDYYASGAHTSGRTDLHQNRSLRYGLLALGQLYWGVCSVTFYSVGLSSSDGFNLMENNAWFVDSNGKADADYITTILDWREGTNDIPFVAKGWADFWNPKTWAVAINQEQDPIDGDATVCPFVEWNRVSMGGTVVTMNSGGRNCLARSKLVRRGSHTFSAEIKLDNANSKACVSAHGYDKLNGLAVARSTILSGVNDWTTVSVSFTPRQHGNPRIPDTPICVLMIDHNGTGTCQVRNPKIIMPGASVGEVNAYFNFTATDISWTPETPGPGSAVVFSVSVTNNGNTASPAGIINGVCFNVDGVAQTYSDNNTASFAPGETRVLTANNSYVTSGTNTWTATSGTHTIQAVFDDVNRFPNESDKTDNTISETLTVSSTDTYFDLTVTSISLSPSAPIAGDAVRFSATIKNTGNIATPDGITHGIGFSVDGTQVSWSANNSTSLGAGESRTQDADGGPNSNQGLWASTAGSHSVEAWVDDIARFTSERDTTNNKLTHNFTVANTGTQPTERFLGIFVSDSDLGGGAPWNADVITNWENLTGPSKVKLWHWYIPMGYNYMSTELQTVDTKGYIPYVSISSSSGADPWPSVTWANISGGSQDSVIDNLANIIASFGKLVILQYDWEMNIKEGAGTAAEFVAAHQRIVTRVRAITSLAKFHWCPAGVWGNPDFTPYWPGDAYVDYAGYNSYNWGDYFTAGAWSTPAEVFGPSYDLCGTLTAKPLWIGETGCASTPGDKPAWIRSAYIDVIPTQYPNIQAVLYYHDSPSPGPDWRITKPTSDSTAAWKDVQSNSYWGGTVVPPVTITAPSQAANAGLTRLHWHDECDAISLYHAVNNPTGTWACMDWWQDTTGPGWVDWGGRAFFINQAYPADALLPYLPILQTEPSVVTLRCTRARLSERPALRTLINDIAVQQDPNLVDKVQWLGCQITTQVNQNYQGSHISRPAYIEARLRFKPAYVNRGAESFWFYEAANGTQNEVDLLENSGGAYRFWETNIHQRESGPHSYNRFNQTWKDGNWHIFGLLWQASGMTIYYDNSVAPAEIGYIDGSDKVANPNTSDAARGIADDLRIFLGIGGSSYWYEAYGIPDDNPTEYYTMDVDYVRVWKAP